MNLEDKKRALMNKVESGANYYDWLESSGGAYIELDFTFDSTKTYKLETTFMKTIANNANHYFSGWNYANLVQGYSGGYKFGSDNAYFQAIQLNTYYDVTHDIDYGRGTNIATIDVGGTIYTQTKSNSSLSATKPFPLFAVWYGNTKYTGTTRLKETKIYIDNVLEYDLKPTIQNGENGMINVLTNTFYGNMGSGSFTIGND